MNLKKLQFFVSVATLAFVGSASAQPYFTGSTEVLQSISSSDSTWTSSSLTLNSANLLLNPNGTFALEPNFSGFTAYNGTLSGLSASPTTENINNFFVFSTSDSRFDFDLATITETAPGDYSGTGTLVDTLGVYSATPGIFNLGFSSPEGAPLDEGNYSFGLAALTPVPEPATTSLFAAGLAGAWAFLRRKH